MTAIHKHYSIDEWKKIITTQEWENENMPFENTVVSMGTSDTDFDKVCVILESFPKLTTICIDVANGYSEHFVEFVKKTRHHFPTHTIVAGNVVTGEMTEELILAGADIVKVGLGSGSGCSTRLKTGVGYPQLSAVIECADAAHGLGGHIISDGGCVVPGDIAKAFGAGADIVMLGGMLAGYIECDGALVDEDGFLLDERLTDEYERNGTKMFKEFYGMSSEKAMDKHSGGMNNYRASEGHSMRIPFKNEFVCKMLQEIEGGLRSSCTYVGASSIKELPKRTTFIRVNNQVNTSYLQYLK
jgi:GMP reductase